MFVCKIAQCLDFVDLEAFQEKKVYNNRKPSFKVLEEFPIIL